MEDDAVVPELTQSNLFDKKKADEIPHQQQHQQAQQNWQNQELHDAKIFGQRAGADEQICDVEQETKSSSNIFRNQASAILDPTDALAVLKSGHSLQYTPPGALPEVSPANFATGSCVSLTDPYGGMSVVPTLYTPAPGPGATGNTSLELPPTFRIGMMQTAVGGAAFLNAPVNPVAGTTESSTGGMATAGPGCNAGSAAISNLLSLPSQSLSSERIGELFEPLLTTGSSSITKSAEQLLHHCQSKEQEVTALQHALAGLMAAQGQTNTNGMSDGNRTSDDEVEALRKKCLELEKSQSAGRTVTNIQTLLAKAVKDFFPELLSPTQLSDTEEEIEDALSDVDVEITAVEIQSTVTGYLSKRGVEEAVHVLNEALHDPSVDPYRRNSRGFIEAFDPHSSSIRFVTQKYGPRMAQLVARKKREQVDFATASAARLKSLYALEEADDFSVNEMILNLMAAIREARDSAALALLSESTRLAQQKQPALESGGGMATTTTTTSGRKVTLNPRFYEGAAKKKDRISLAGPHSQSNSDLPPLSDRNHTGGSLGGNDGSPGDSGAGGGSMDTRALTGGSLLLSAAHAVGDGVRLDDEQSMASGAGGSGHRKRRPRSSTVLAEDLRESFITYMRMHSTMSESSAQMFAGAANALVHRVLVELEGDRGAVDVCLDFSELEDLVQNYHQVFERHTKNAYANLPRIWKMLQGFVSSGGRLNSTRGRPGRGRGARGGRGRRGGRGPGRRFSVARELEEAVQDEEEDDEDDEDEDDDDSVSSDDEESRKRIKVDGPEDLEQRPAPQHEEDDDDEYDLRGVIFGLPPKPRPRRYGRRRKRGGYQGTGSSFSGGLSSRAGALANGGTGGGAAGYMGGKRPSTPMMVNEEIRMGFLGWMALNTCNRGSSLNTIVRSVNNFLARSLPRLPRYENMSEGGSRSLDIESLRGLLERSEAELTAEVARGTNQSLRTFWRHFMNFLRDSSGEGDMEYFVTTGEQLDADVVPVGVGVPGSGAYRRVADSEKDGGLRGSPDGSGTAEEDSLGMTSDAGKYFRVPKKGVNGLNGGGGTFDAEDKRMRRKKRGFSDPEGSTHDTESRSLIPEKRRLSSVPCRVRGGSNGDGMKGEGVNDRLADSLKQNEDLDVPFTASAQVQQRSLPSSRAITGFTGINLPNMASASTMRRQQGMVMDRNAREGFTEWMKTNTKMQPVSMTTAMRTANRVLFSMLLLHPQPNTSLDRAEMSLEQIRVFVDEHYQDFLAEVGRTANVSVKTFWRHFIRFLSGDNAVREFNNDLSMSLQQQQHQHNLELYEQQQALQQAQQHVLDQVHKQQHKQEKKLHEHGRGAVELASSHSISLNATSASATDHPSSLSLPSSASAPLLAGVEGKSGRTGEVFAFHGVDPILAASTPAHVTSRSSSVSAHQSYKPLSSSDARRGSVGNAEIAFAFEPQPQNPNVIKQQQESSSSSSSPPPLQKSQEQQQPQLHQSSQTLLLHHPQQQQQPQELQQYHQQLRYQQQQQQQHWAAHLHPSPQQYAAYFYLQQQHQQQQQQEHQKEQKQQTQNQQQHLQQQPQQQHQHQQQGEKEQERQEHQQQQLPQQHQQHLQEGHHCHNAQDVPFHYHALIQSDGVAQMTSARGACSGQQTVIDQLLVDRFEAYMGELGFFNQPQIWTVVRDVVTVIRGIMEPAGEHMFLRSPQAVTEFFDRHFAHPLVVANVQNLKHFYEFCRSIAQ
ncbi:hypothetical protein Naga_100003g95 [Nannochloropsis gaditana]|uniref:Uncharacterized protein n=1 Tax=Nannochloropsis gaditana TaxID=72520 RepID=W7UBF4_9STRA|nr:hypothetical protein Naga_100003g95 [Nannochloropsis gaditana]